MKSIAKCMLLNKEICLGLNIIPTMRGQRMEFYHYQNIKIECNKDAKNFPKLVEREISFEFLAGSWIIHESKS